MAGIDFAKPVTYKVAALRFFEKNEHHITRFCPDNVLLLVFDGVLRFSEDGVPREVHAGEYYIQRKNCHQTGETASDAPQYLYVHFDGEWTDAPDALAYAGRYDYPRLSELIVRIDEAAHQKVSCNEMQYLFLKLLLTLRDKPARNPTAQLLSGYIDQNLTSITSLSDICEAFHYSKNYIIRIFNREFGLSPIQYLNEAKLRRAMYLLETTSKPIKEIMTECGYGDYPYFYKRFVAKTGLSPQKWRRKIQENPLFQ